MLDFRWTNPYLISFTRIKLTLGNYWAVSPFKLHVYGKIPMSVIIVVKGS